jgi:peptide/nickel transport system permease protein
MRIIVLLGVLAVLALAGPWIAPFDSETQHRQFLYAPPMPPRVVHNGALHAPFVYPLTLQERIARRFAEDRSRTLPLPWSAATAAERSFLLGTDSLGRDVLSRVLHGARVSVSLALVGVAGAVLLGLLFGATAGASGGWLDEVVMRIADLIAVLPVIYIVLVLRAAMPLVLDASTIFVLMAAIFAAVGWPFVARGVRNIMTSERERDYVLAARASGAGPASIVFRHLLPACRGYLLVQATVLLPAFILAEATLSYVGMGFPPQVPTWGTMLVEAANVNSLTLFPWTLTPAAAIALTVLGANALLHSGKIRAQTPRFDVR